MHELERIKLEIWETTNLLASLREESNSAIKSKEEETRAKLLNAEENLSSGEKEALGKAKKLLSKEKGLGTMFLIFLIYGLAVFLGCYFFHIETYFNKTLFIIASVLIGILLSIFIVVDYNTKIEKKVKRLKDSPGIIEYEKNKKIIENELFSLKQEYANKEKSLREKLNEQEKSFKLHKHKGSIFFYAEKCYGSDERFEIYLDGLLYTSTSRGGMLQIRLNPGIHSIYVRHHDCSWITTSPVHQISDQEFPKFYICQRKSPIMKEVAIEEYEKKAGKIEA